jgi:hypothetical protein
MTNGKPRLPTANKTGRSEAANPSKAEEWNRQSSLIRANPNPRPLVIEYRTYPLHSTFQQLAT